jgi:hypothetical protein
LGCDCPEGLESVLTGYDRFLKFIGDDLGFTVGSGRIESQILRDDIIDMGRKLKLTSSGLIGKVCS